VNLIEEGNPEWKDLYENILEYLDSRFHGMTRTGELMTISTGMSEKPVT